MFLKLKPAAESQRGFQRELDEGERDGRTDGWMDRWMDGCVGWRVGVWVNCISLLHTHKHKLKGCSAPHTNLTGHSQQKITVWTWRRRGQAVWCVALVSCEDEHSKSFFLYIFVCFLFFYIYISSNLIIKTNRTSAAHNGTVRQRRSVSESVEKARNTEQPQLDWLSDWTLLWTGTNNFQNYYFYYFYY